MSTTRMPRLSKFTAIAGSATCSPAVGHSITDLGLPPAFCRFHDQQMPAPVLHSYVQPPTDDGACATPGSALTAQRSCWVTRSTAL